MFSFPYMQDQSIRVAGVHLSSDRLPMSEQFSPVLRGRKSNHIKVLQVSGCSRCTRVQGDPSPAKGPFDAVGSIRHTLLGHRHGSGAWTAWQ